LNSAREAVEKEPECMKLKNPLLEAVARERLNTAGWKKAYRVLW
jgi:hypothetical protein